jgi:hypothetical protein
VNRGSTVLSSLVQYFKKTTFWLHIVNVFCMSVKPKSIIFLTILTNLFLIPKQLIFRSELSSQLSAPFEPSSYFEEQNPIDDVLFHSIICDVAVGIARVVQSLATGWIARESTPSGVRLTVPSRPAPKIHSISSTMRAGSFLGAKRPDRSANHAVSGCE